MSQPTDNKQLRVYDDVGNFKRFSVDEVIAKGYNKWQGWHCSAGARNLYIDYDGNVWRANCFSSNKYGQIHKQRVEKFTQKDPQDLDQRWKEYRESIIGADGSELRKKWLNENTENGWPMPKVDYKNSEQQHKLMAKIAELEEEFFTKRIGDKDNYWYKEFMKDPESWSWESTKDDLDTPGLLGNINDSWQAPTTWTKCPYSSCGCGADVILSKAKNAKAVENLFVTHNQLNGQQQGNSIDNITSQVGVEMNFPIIHQILWDITRRCNYDCSYCWPSVHNNKEKYHNTDKIMQAIDTAINSWADGDSIRWNFGGGEPTMHPDFLKILEKLNNMNQWVLVTTNGARSGKYFKELVKYCNSINMSAHFESMDQFKGNEQRFIDNCRTIIEHHKTVDKDHWLEIKLMTPPGMLDRAEQFRNKIVDLGLNENGANGRQIGAISLVPIRDITDSSQLVDYSENEIRYFQQQ